MPTVDASLLDFSPVQSYLEDLHARIAPLNEGALASYIPELTHADPNWFGIAIATVDGNVYQVGDTRQGFTIQSISKALTYGLALQDNDVEAVLGKVGVEPSGEPFNSISLDPVTGQPRNPMINAGAITTTGMIQGKDPADRLRRILNAFEGYTGHPVSVDERVYASEKRTGHRNRAITHLLLGFDIVEGDPEEVLDLYFKQCSITVTCRDLALIGACLANNGVNPITNKVALDRRYVSKVLSVMSSCGMYDFSGGWVYNVGIPAKSGVGGGIMAVLPGQLGIGVFSPLLDERGNSVRGIRVCQEFSRDLGLHMFNAARSSSASVVRGRYDLSGIGSRKLRREPEQAVLREHGHLIHVYQLQGELMFGSTASLIKEMLESLNEVQFFVMDMKHVVAIDASGQALMTDMVSKLDAAGKQLLFTETENHYPFQRHVEKSLAGSAALPIFDFLDTDHALEWCEDRLLESYATAGVPPAVGSLAEQDLCQGLDPDALARLEALAKPLNVPAGDTIFNRGEEARSLFFLVEGEVEVVLPAPPGRDTRLATLRPGMSFGEMAMINRHQRSATVRALKDSLCYEVFFDDLDDALRSQLLVNLAEQLSHKLTRSEREMQLCG
jgi:glutaminase